MAGMPEDVIPGTGHWSTFGLDGRMQPDNWHYRTAPPPADEAKVRESHGQWRARVSKPRLSPNNMIWVNSKN